MKVSYERLYANADMTQVREMMLAGCYRLIFLLEEAKKIEVLKQSFPKEFKFYCEFIPNEQLCSFDLLKRQNDAQDFWRGIIKMITYIDGLEDL